MLKNSSSEWVALTDIRFDEDVPQVHLSDGRLVSLPIDKFSWLDWLTSASPEQRAGWAIEPGGYAVYWEDLDDGIEVGHLLGLQPLS